MKLLSIVFSFKNEEKYWISSKRISSIGKNSRLEVELIFVNDDSADNSEEVLLDLQKTFL